MSAASHPLWYVLKIRFDEPEPSEIRAYVKLEGIPEEHGPEIVQRLVHKFAIDAEREDRDLPSGARLNWREKSPPILIGPSALIEELNPVYKKDGQTLWLTRPYFID